MGILTTNNVTMIIGAFIVMWIAFEVIGLMKSIGLYFKSKTKKVTSLEERMENTVNIMLIINKIIELNLIDRRSIQITLKVPFNVIHMDNDIKELAEYVHDSLAKELFTSHGELIVVPDYIEKYIVSQATSALIQCYKETNQYIAQMSSVV